MPDRVRGAALFADVSGFTSLTCVNTRFSSFCDRLMEAGWLLAAISVPLFFNVYSGRVFEADKLALLRSIALVVATAWLCKLIETGFVVFRNGDGARWRQLHRSNPLAFPVLVLMGIYLLSTAASVVPYVSVWGSYQRLQGTYSTFSYIAIFAVMLHVLKTRAQLERLLTVMVLTSLPVAAYGWLQHFELDPLPWAVDVTQRIASSMGNPIFIGAYLIIVLPITIGRWLNIVSQILRTPATNRTGNSATVRQRTDGSLNATKDVGNLPHLVLAACYTLIIVFQVLGIYWSGSRGPWLGILAGVFVMLHLFGVRRRLTWLWTGSLSFAIAGIAFLVVLNTAGSPLESVKTAVPALGRLGSVFSEGGTNKARFLIWEGAVGLVSPHEPIGFGKYADTLLNPVRPYIGYGPEAMSVAYNKFYPPGLAHLDARNASPDRSHNETFDSLVITGWAGFIAYITLFGSVFYRGFKWLGLGGERHDAFLFVLCWLVGGAIGATAGYCFDPSTAKYVGVALPVGLLFGVLIYLMSQTLFFRRGQPMPPSTEDQILLMALIGAVVAHFVEIHFGIAIAATRTYFWILSALIVLVGLRLQQTAMLRPMPATGTLPVTIPRKRLRGKVSKARPMPPVIPQTCAVEPSGGWGNAVVNYGLLLGATLMILVFDFINPSFGETPNSVWIVALIAFTTVVASLCMAAQVQVDHGETNSLAEWTGRFVIIAVTGVTVMLIYSGLHLQRLVPRAGPNTAETVLRNVTAVADGISWFYGVFFTLMTMLAVFLMQGTPKPAVSIRKPFLIVVYGILVVVCASAVITTNLNGIRADVFYKQGLTLEGQEQWDGSILMYLRAIELAPDQDFYYLSAGRAYLEKAKHLTDVKQRDQLLQISQQQRVRARDLSPLNTDHTANLARLYRTWAELTSEPAQRGGYLNKSLEYYEQAKLLSPNNAQLYNEHAMVYMLMGEPDKALAMLEQSLKVDQAFGQTHLLRGDIYLKRQDPAKMDENLVKAAEALSLALQYDSSALQARSALDLIYSRLNRVDRVPAEKRFAVQPK